MKSHLLFVSCVLLTGCVTTASPRQEPVYLYQTVQPKECVLAETGPLRGRDEYGFIGKVREVDSQVYECEVEIPMGEFKKKLGYCVMRGHNYSAEYSFFHGKPDNRRHSCDARPLKNGNFYFQASGIDQDSCDWICFPGWAN